MSGPCIVCGTGAANFARSARFPRVVLCVPCLNDWFTWLYHRGLADGNPLVLDMIHHPVSIWIHSEHGGMRAVELKGFKVGFVNSS